MKNYDLSNRTIWEYLHGFRIILKLYLQQFIPLISLPGPVEIDETQLGARRRGSHGRLPSRAQLVFGLYNIFERIINFLGIKCRTTGIVLLFHVPNRRRATLVPYIENHVNPGSTIISDMYSVYVNSRNGESYLSTLGYDHHINHSENYVDPVNNWVHTNNIE